jgi:hypothetical protein
MKLTRTAPGHYEGQAKVDQQGAYRVESGEKQVVAAAGALNPKEFSNLLPTDEIVKPLVSASHGYLGFANAMDDSPQLRRIKPGARPAGLTGRG